METTPAMNALLKQIRPDVVVLWPNASRQATIDHVLENSADFDCQPIPAEELPEPCRNASL